MLPVRRIPGQSRLDLLYSIPKVVFVVVDSIGSPRTNSTPDTDYPFAKPYVYSTHTSMGLALAGYRMTTQNYIEFSLSLAVTSPSTLKITLGSIVGNMQIYRLGVYIIMANPASSYVWLYTYSICSLIQTNHCQNFPYTITLLVLPI
jgi:hypothetical protein